MHNIIVGAPFGNYITRKGVKSTIGTFTNENRAGILKRIWRVLSTVRYYHKPQLWLNRLSLPNPGINSLDNAHGKYLSIHGFFKSDWEILILRALEKDPEMLELNLSCPNVTKTSINEALEAAHYAYKLFGNRVIAKLSPVRWMEFVNPLTDLGVSTFHLCNTIASPGGGFSGKVLKQYSIWAVEEVRKKYGYAHIIGGGGVTDLQDVKDYISAGADDVAVASMLFNPLNWGKLDVFKDYLCTLS